jgi:hypothetical protein
MPDPRCPQPDSLQARFPPPATRRTSRLTPAARSQTHYLTPPAMPAARHISCLTPRPDSMSCLTPPHGSYLPLPAPSSPPGPGERSSDRRRDLPLPSPAPECRRPTLITFPTFESAPAGLWGERCLAVGPTQLAKACQWAWSPCRGPALLEFPA